MPNGTIKNVVTHEELNSTKTEIQDNINTAKDELQTSIDGATETESVNASLNSGNDWPFYVGSAIRALGNSCHWYRFGKVMIVMLCFEALVTIGSENNIAIFPTKPAFPYDLTPDGLVTCLMSLGGSDPNASGKCVALRREGLNLVNDAPMAPGLWRGFMVYMLP